MRHFIVLCVFFIVLADPAFADKIETGVGFFKSVNGEVSLLRDDVTLKVQPGQQILPSDTIVTGDTSTAAIIFKDGTRMTLGAGSELVVQKYDFRPHREKYDFKLFLKQGSVLYSSGKLGELAPEKVNLNTPRATVGIRGTRLLLSVKQ